MPQDASEVGGEVRLIGRADYATCTPDVTPNIAALRLQICLAQPA